MVDMMYGTAEDLGRYSSVSQYVSALRLYGIVVIGVLVVMTVISSTVASRVLAGRISHPIRELARATERIARGDYGHRVDVKAKDEIRSLVASFNHMTLELEENRRNLIEMARREAQVARDYEIAHSVQQNLFPRLLPRAEGWEFAAMCRPARAVGGDYYDIFEVAPGKVLFAQGDVSGKGLGASLVMSGVHAVVRSWGGESERDLGHLIQELNQYLIVSSSDDTFVSLLVGLLDCPSGRLFYVNCGHPPALLVGRGNGTPQELMTGGPILGVIEGDLFETGVTDLSPGDTVAVVSDGVTEATDPEDRMFDVERLVQAVTESRGRAAEVVMGNLLGAVDAFIRGAEQADDISIMVLRKPH
jgi:sigma-B regulation protein RsbU (phosphoserine phosphatase)